MVPTLVMSMQINYDKLKHFPRSSLPVSSANNVENAAEMQCLHKAGSGFCCGQLGCAEGHSPSGMKTKSIYLYILSEILNTVSHLLLLHSSSHLRLPSSIREASSRSNSFITGPMVLYRKKRIIFVNRIYQAKRFNKNFLLNSIYLAVVHSATNLAFQCTTNEAWQ